jgi:insulin receptor
VREDPEALKSLRGCRVVEGSLSILNLDEFNSTDSFPELVEITGYLLIYRLFGVRSLKDLFPNLAIIRGKNLFQHYALVLYEMENLEEVGLTNLQIIQRGSVRIEKNAKLCFANTIDWKSIAIQEGYEEYIGVSI